MNSSLSRIIVFCLYLILLVIGLYHHEMWRDEYEWFLLAKIDEFSILGYDISPGHGIIWRNSLWLFTQITHNPSVMKILHGMIAAGFAFFLLFKSPFKLWLSAGLLLSYFFLFEYALISRNYAYGVLFMMVFATIYQQKGLTWWAAFFLILLSNASVYALMVSSVILCWLFYTELKKGEFTLETFKAILPKMLVIGIGILASAYQIMPSPEHTFPVEKATLPFNDYRYNLAITQFFSVFVPICRFEDAHFWNTNFMMDEMGLVSWYWILALLILTSVPLIKRRSVLVLYLSGVLLILFFQYYTGFRFARYYGHIFILWIFCLWILSHKNLPNMGFTKNQTGVILALILIQAIGGISMYAADYSLKFSRGTEAGRYIRDGEYKDAFIIGTVDFSMGPIAGEINRPIYYLEQGGLSTFTRWDSNRKSSVDTADYIKAFESAPKGKDILLVCNRKVEQFSYFNPKDESLGSETFEFENYRLTFLKEYEAGIEEHEGYWIFKVEKLPADQSSLEL